MKPEKILESNMIDIVFENRNKEYGAYQLRKNYSNRLSKSIGFTALVVLAFALTQSFKVPSKNGKVIIDNVPEVKLTEVHLKVDEPKQKEEPEKTIQKKDASTAVYNTPKIVEDILANKPMSTVQKVDTSLYGNIESDGKKVTTEVGISKDPPHEGSGTNPKVTEPEESNDPITVAEFMPEYPGGNAALIRFLQSNLRQPDDFEEGQKVTVVASFVVDNDGNITGINISQHGRNDLDNEVIRVIKKMPRWKPGMQNGRSVAVYYKVPVTFVSTE